MAARYLDVDGGFDGFRAMIAKLISDLGIPANLTGLGISSPDIDAIVSGALKDPSTGGNPIAMTPENTRILVESCFA